MQSARVRELREYCDGLRKENSKHRNEADGLRRRIEELRSITQDELTQQLVSAAESKALAEISHAQVSFLSQSVVGKNLC